MEIGEAAAHLSPELTAANPDIPWRQISGMRNVLIHDYDNVSFAEVAGTIDDDLPKLHATVRRLIEQEPRSDELADLFGVDIEGISPAPSADLDHDF